MYEVTLAHPVTVSTEAVFYFYRVHSGSADTSVSIENQMKKLRSHVAITRILQQHFTALEQPDEEAANKLMTFLWMSLYQASQLPASEARKATRELNRYGLFPYHRPAQCNLQTSYMADTSSLVGRVFDKVYMHLHTRWGYAAMRLMQKLR